MFRYGTSPILKDVAMAYGKEVVVDMIINHILKLARTNFIKLPGGENDVKNAAELIYSKMKDCNCGELMLFFEKYQRKELIDTIRCLSYSELNDAIVAFTQYRYDKILRVEAEDVGDEHNLRIGYVISLMYNIKSRDSYGENYIKIIGDIAENIVRYAEENNMDLRSIPEKYILAQCEKGLSYYDYINRKNYESML